MGVVTDFGASDSNVVRLAPSAQATSTAEAIAVNDPATQAATIGASSRRTSPAFAASGTASATVAGPSRKWTNCAPSK